MPLISPPPATPPVTFSAAFISSLIFTTPSVPAMLLSSPSSLSEFVVSFLMAVFPSSPSPASIFPRLPSAFTLLRLNPVASIAPT
ncbi:MAG: hypothetical protein ABI680_15010, partial [Chthoniobacteraceae bacterium]